MYKNIQALVKYQDELKSELKHEPIGIKKILNAKQTNPFLVLKMQLKPHI